MNVIGTIKDPVHDFDLGNVVTLLRRQAVGHKVLAEGLRIVEGPLALMLRLDDLVRLQKHVLLAIQWVFHSEKLYTHFKYFCHVLYCVRYTSEAVNLRYSSDISIPFL